MLKKILMITVASMVAAGTFGCKPAGKYADLKDYLNESIKANEDYIAALEKANSPKEVAEAITELGNKTEKLGSRTEELSRKYPELKSMGKTPPAELKDEFERLEKMTQRLLNVSMKMMKYMMDPEVMKATQEMARKSSRSSVFK